MLQLSDFKHSIVARAVSLGFDKATPTSNRDFWVSLMDVNEDGAKTVHKRHVFYGTGTPSDTNYTTIWLRSDNHKIFRYNFTGELIEETKISELFESNY